MTNTNIVHKVRAVMAKHGLVLEVLTMLGVLAICSTIDGVGHQAHFLQTRVVQVVQEAPSAQSSSRLSLEEKRDERLQERIEKLITEKSTTVAVATPEPYLEEELRPAAAEESSSSASIEIVISEISSSSEAASVAASSSSLSESSVSSSSSARAVSSASSSSAISRAPFVPKPVLETPAEDFPSFGRAIHPVSKVPDWGTMTTPKQWERRYSEMSEEDFVRVPSYNLTQLTVKMSELIEDRFDADNIKIITAKLYYSTRHFGAYDLDSHEFEAVHPGVDLKLPEGMPLGAVAGGRVHDVRRSAEGLGLHVIIEHRAPDGQTYYSIYGHMERAAVIKGADVKPGQTVGYVGMTGYTSGPHLHLQIDRGTAGEASHGVYWPSSVPSRSEADRFTVSPIAFIRQYADGE
jgi:murein DD-endopeptidase MepM/ murein hydrolase activator NlpD